MCRGFPLQRVELTNLELLQRVVELESLRDEFCALPVDPVVRDVHSQQVHVVVQQATHRYAAFVCQCVPCQEQGTHTVVRLKSHQK